MGKGNESAAVGETHGVIIVGGGPVGLICGLVLAQNGVDILVLEAEEDIVPSPRALMYVSPSSFKNKLIYQKQRGLR